MNKLTSNIDLQTLQKVIDEAEQLALSLSGDFEETEDSNIKTIKEIEEPENKDEEAKNENDELKNKIEDLEEKLMWEKDDHKKTTNLYEDLEDKFTCDGDNGKNVINENNNLKNRIDKLEKLHDLAHKKIKRQAEQFKSTVERNNELEEERKQRIVKDKDDHILLLKAWNSHKNLIYHKNISAANEQIMNRVLKRTPVKEIIKAFKNLSDILASKKHYWSHDGYTMSRFLEAKMDTFLDEAKPFKTYKRRY